MLKVGGENVAALEIESFLSKHPAVQLAQVIGREDERLQEVPIAFIELSPGQEASEAQLIEFVKARLPVLKCRVRFTLSKSGPCPVPRCRNSDYARLSKYRLNTKHSFLSNR